MSYNYRKLFGKIAEKYQKQYIFARAMGWSERTCSKKLTGQIEWRQSEIMKACELLDISDAEICIYFFNVKVQ